MKTLLLTGASGFVGHHILPLLRQDYTVTTCGRKVGQDVICDLTQDVPVFDHAFDVVVHAAGKAHVTPKNDQEVQAFFEVNEQGTINLCRGLERIGVPQSFIYLSSVAVYGLDEGEAVDETWPLNGRTPYAQSKIKAESYLQAWCTAHHVLLTILRPSLMVGPNPPGNLNRMIKGIRQGRYLNIAGGRARKSMLMVEDIARIIPLVENLGGIYNLCDDEHPSFKALSELISRQLRRKTPLNIPYWLARCFLFNSHLFLKMTQSLTFSNQKAKATLGWCPTDVLTHFRI